MEVPLDDTVRVARVARYVDCGGSGTHRLSLIGLDTIVHRPRRMAMEDMVNVCIVLTTFCFIGVCVCLKICKWKFDCTPEAANLVVLCECSESYHL